MADITVLTDAENSAAVLPSLALLSHRIRVLPANASSLIEIPPHTVIIIDARSDLANAKMLCKLLVASNIDLPVLLVITESAFAVINADWHIDDIIVAHATPGEIEARLRLLIQRSRIQNYGLQSHSGIEMSSSLPSQQLPPELQRRSANRYAHNGTQHHSHVMNSAASSPYSPEQLDHSSHRLAQYSQSDVRSVTAPSPHDNNSTLSHTMANSEGEKVGNDAFMRSNSQVSSLSHEHGNIVDIHLANNVMFNAAPRSSSPTAGYTIYSEQEVQIAGLYMDLHEYSAQLHGRPLDLAYKEFVLLKYLVQHPHQVFSRNQLLQEVWGFDYYGGVRTVDVHIRRLRAKLGGDYEHFITTIRNVGYRFDPPADDIIADDNIDENFAMFDEAMAKHTMKIAQQRRRESRS